MWSGDYQLPGGSRTFAVSLPIPVFAPVTMITFPDKSGMSSTVNLGLGGKSCDIVEAIVRE